MDVQDERSNVIWGLEDYAIFVPMSDDFYKTLKFKRTDLQHFHLDTYERQPSYHDSRTYLKPIFQHFLSLEQTVDVYDVGGYIGRFSIEAALCSRELALSNNITCFEPGDTADMLERNLRLNELENQIHLVRNAVSNNSGSVTFAIKSNAKITSRIVPPKTNVAKTLGPMWTKRTVATICLKDLMSGHEGASNRPFVCKIDTEGHEASVIEGIGSKSRATTPHVLVIEFWPSLRENSIDGIPFEKYIFSNYSVFNIRSSLYPKGFSRLDNFNEVAVSIESHEVNNLDLLLVSNTVPRQDALLDSIAALALQ